MVKSPTKTLSSHFNYAPHLFYSLSRRAGIVKLVDTDFIHGDINVRDHTKTHITKRPQTNQSKNQSPQ